MKLWAKALDPDFAHSERVARLSLELYDGLAARQLLSSPTASENGSGARESLLMAALLHDVGKSEGNKGHHKASLELIKAHSTPLGWNPQDMQRAATVARFHCGALPTRSHKALRDLLPDEQKTTIQLAAILRLANAFDASHDGHIRRLQIENGQTENGRIGSGKPGDVTKHLRGPNGFLGKPANLAKNEALVIAADGFHIAAECVGRFIGRKQDRAARGEGPVMREPARRDGGRPAEVGDGPAAREGHVVVERGLSHAEGPGDGGDGAARPMRSAGAAR